METQTETQMRARDEMQNDGVTAGSEMEMGAFSEQMGGWPEDKRRCSRDTKTAGERKGEGEEETGNVSI